MSTYTFPMLDPHQSRLHEPTDWECDLADAIEDAFGRGKHGLSDLVAELNASRVRPRHGGAWNEDNFKLIMKELGA